MSYDAAVKKYDDGEYQVAFDLFLALAEQGNADAMNYLGMMYGAGLGVEKDDRKSLLYHKRAGRKEASSMHFGNIARQYGKMGNRRRALYWAHKANAESDKSASLELAKLLLRKPRSDTRKRALQLLQDAASGVAYVDISYNDKEEARKLLNQLP